MQKKRLINKLFKKREWCFSIIDKIVLLNYLKKIDRNIIEVYINLWAKGLTFYPIINPSNWTFSD
jgi:hypothetical protein